jgi:hypothetical protein
MGTPAEYKAGLERAIANGWLSLHESGTFVKFAEAGAAMLRVGARVCMADGIATSSTKPPRSQLQ